METLPPIQRDDSAIDILPVKERTPLSFSSLPAELRVHILEQVFEDGSIHDGFSNHGGSSGIHLDEDYSPANNLAPLLTCRQFYQDGFAAAFNRTNFVVSNMFFDISQELSVLHPKQVAAIRSIAFVS